MNIIRVLLHVIAILVVLAITWSMLQGKTTYLLLLGCWWMLGIYAAVSHTQWVRTQANAKPIDRAWSFYLWYSLNGLILLVCTKGIEWKEFLRDTFSPFRSD